MSHEYMLFLVMSAAVIANLIYLARSERRRRLGNELLEEVRLSNEGEREGIERCYRLIERIRQENDARIGRGMRVLDETGILALLMHRPIEPSDFRVVERPGQPLHFEDDHGAA